jgi:hypothetical protein
MISIAAHYLKTQQIKGRRAYLEPLCNYFSNGTELGWKREGSTQFVYLPLQNSAELTA